MLCAEVPKFPVVGTIIKNHHQMSKDKKQLKADSLKVCCVTTISSIFLQQHFFSSDDFWWLLILFFYFWWLLIRLMARSWEKVPDIQRAFKTDGMIIESELHRTLSTAKRKFWQIFHIFVFASSVHFKHALIQARKLLMFLLVLCLLRLFYLKLASMLKENQYCYSYSYITGWSVQEYITKKVTR